jgi:exonuclease SbcC
VILKKVDIRDFRSHKQTTVNFDEGISVIVGDNGSGKTSILESVNFALFKQKPNVNMDDLIRRGADSAEVSVTFNANGRTFRATRGRRTGKAYGSALYKIDNGEVLLVKGEDEITKEIEDILGLGGELFTSAIYIKQGEIDKLISAPPAERKEHIGKLLGADELERAHEGMKKLVKEYDDRIKRLSHVPEEIEETEQKIKKVKGSIKTLREELKKSSETSALVKKELKETQTVLKELEQLKNLEYEKTLQENKIENLFEKIREIEKNEKELNETQSFHETYTAVEKEIKALSDKSRKFYELQERREGLRRELSNAEKQISRLEIGIKEHFNEYGEILGKKFRDFGKLKEHHEKLQRSLESKKEKVTKKIEDASSKIARTRGKNLEIEKAISDLETAGTKCPVCKGPLDKKHKEDLLLEYSQKIEKNLKDIESWESVLKEQRAESQNIEESLQRQRSINLDLLKSLLDEKTDIEKTAQKTKSEVKANERVLKDLKDLEKLLRGKEREKSSLQKNNERYIIAKNYLRRYLPEKEDFQAESEEIEKRLLRLSKDIKKLGGPLDTKKFEKIKQNESELLDKFNDAQKEEARLESSLDSERKNLESSKRHLIELKSKEKEREKLSNFLVLLAGIRRLFHKDALQRDLRTKALPLIESYTQEIFDMFDLPYTDLELTDDFNVVLFGSHGEESVDMLSGGERIASALALRMGIAKALSGSAMELIILDEPTIHLDSQRRQDLVEIIKKLSSIPQTIVVTHDKEFEQAADKLIVVEKVDGISKIS